MTMTRRGFTRATIAVGATAALMTGFVGREMGRAYAESVNDADDIARDEDIPLAEAETVREERVASFANKSGGAGALAGVATGLGLNVLGDGSFDNDPS